MLECIVAFDSKDYSVDKRDRMLYAIILGWDDKSYESFGWDKDIVEEYKQLHNRFEKLKEAVPLVHGEWVEYQVPHIICCSECDWGTGCDEKGF